jgi:iron complex outermembrane receptor protein
MISTTTPMTTPLLRLKIVAVPLLLSLLGVGNVQAEEMDGGDLADLSLDELLSTEITTLSRKAENLGSAPAAVHVISQSDIRRSGARSIAELLRMVPGMQVAQIDGNKWAVTSRGANGRFANKLLVLMDGRTLYNPMLSGVQWDVQDTDIAAIERIEVIRGPGATMWGSNAVNGIVNIITKHSADTKGGNISVAGGMDGYETTVRYGAEAGDSAFRVFGKVFDRDGNVNMLGLDTEDYSEMLRFGGRYDWDGNEDSEFTLSFETYSGESGEYRISRSLVPPYESISDTFTEISGSFLMGTWSRDFSEDSGLQVRAYYDAHERNVPTYTEDSETFDIDIQHSYAAGENHNLIWGVSYRKSSDETTDTFEIAILPATDTRDRISAFIQDEIGLLDGRVRLIFGSKFEHSQLSDEDIEIEPSVRLSVAVADNQTVWASVSRAVRMPSRGEKGGLVTTSILPPGQPDFPLPVPTVVLINGNPDMLSENIFAVEAGYRLRNRGFLLDAAVFYNQFSDLRSLSFGGPTCEPSGASPLLDPACLFTSTHVVQPLLIGNEDGYDAMGVELWVSKQVSERWRLQGGYTYFRTTESASGTALQLGVVEDSPDHQLSLRSSTDINDSLEFDVMLRWVDELKAQQIDAYTALDLRLAWAPLPSLSVAAVAKNLIAGDHLEFMSELIDLAPVQVESSGFVELRWQFQ